MGDEEPVDLMGRAQIHLLKECPSLIWQALRPIWENTMSPYQSEERKGIDQKACCCCTAMISKASEETGVVAPEDSLVCGMSPAKKWDDCPGCQQQRLEVKDSCYHCQYPWVLETRNVTVVGAWTLKSQCTGPQMQLKSNDGQWTISCPKPWFFLMSFVSVSNPKSECQHYSDNPILNYLVK